MNEALETSYRSVNISKKMLLKNKLGTTHISKTDTMTSYLMKIVELRDQIAVVEDTIEDNERIPISLNRFSPPWQNFIQCFHGREKLREFEQLWDAFVGEEKRLQHVSTNDEDVPSLALNEKVRKGGKKGSNKGQRRNKTRDLLTSKIRI
jgi:hypothetical protein